ncbi:hypothetical protein [Kineosporia babensis]|uniref:Uncharacterized protein n=1 Tax=Kineosporia babensis TaxID=499548 RepID=A0A9X1NB76_9ACTN|nr:hypothetical protein [Kineosporia babensis]MCD5310913.1 hypothetical protein [Kineosporia babensis]
MSQRKDRREFISVSVDFPNHPKLMQLEEDVIPLAGWLAVCAWIYCGQNLTDGEFAPLAVRRIAGVDKQIEKHLLSVGLWHAHGHGCPKCPQPGERMYVSHDYLEHQRAKADAEALREKRRRAGAAGAASRWSRATSGLAEPPPSDGMGDPKQMAFAMAGATDGAWQTDGKDMPKEEEDKKKTKSSSRRRSPERPLPESWKPIARHKAVAASLGLDVDREARQFRLHAEAKDRRQRDWHKAFDLWLEKSLDWGGAAIPSQRQSTDPADPDVVLGRDNWQLPAPPDGVQAGTRAYTEWAKKTSADHFAERRRRAAEVLAERKSA